MFSRAVRRISFFGLACSFLFGSADSILGWVHHTQWPPGSTIVMQLELGPTNVHLDDGFGTWDGSAANALALWNSHLEVVQFHPVLHSTAAKTSGDGVNSVFFSNSVFGDSFGPDTLAITLVLYDSGTYLASREADVVVNQAFHFNSYRGALRAGTAASRVYDIHRVFLHEFGHVLGLAHPDEVGGPPVVAIMNSVISNLDHLAADDIEGVTAIYGIYMASDRIIKCFVGQPIAFQLVTNVPATSYTAINLPPGLRLDSHTGLITGTIALSGDAGFSLLIRGRRTVVSDSVGFFVSPDPPLADLRASFYFTANRLLVDSARKRIYASAAESNSIAVIDTASLSLIKTIPVENKPYGMAFSLDGKKLFVAGLRDIDPVIAVIDLDTLSTRPSLHVPFRSFDIAAGTDNRLFVKSVDPFIAPIDSITGAMLTPFSTSVYQDHMAISPDLRTLYAGQGDFYSFDVSSQTPVLLQQARYDGSVRYKINRDGTFLCIGEGSRDRATKVSASDVHVKLGEYVLPDANLGSGPMALGPVTLSPDDTTTFVGTFTYLTYNSPNTAAVELFDTVTARFRRKISLGTFIPSELLTDSVGRYLFAPSAEQNLPQLRVYATGSVPSLHPPKPKTLLNVSTRLKSQTGDNVLIGGFIISGVQSKTLALRGMGPSLPVAGRLADPVIHLYDGSGRRIATSDNWNSNRARVLFSGLAPKSEHEAAMLVALAPGNYTAILSGANGRIGVGLVEVYDLTPDSNSKLANISTRGKVETGDNVMIGGFIIGGDQPTKVIVRAIGPSLASAGVQEALQDPLLELHGNNGALIFQNDNWRTTQQADIIATRIPPRDNRESAIVATLQPGNYTAIVRGKNNTTGVGLVEVYNLETN
jgi:YVTN family beta-propeller protein